MNLELEQSIILILNQKSTNCGKYGRELNLNNTSILGKDVRLIYEVCLKLI